MDVLQFRGQAVVSDEFDWVWVFVCGVAVDVSDDVCDGELDTGGFIFLRHILCFLHVSGLLPRYLGTLWVENATLIVSRPMMVTVAKSIDAPIKLVFPRPEPAGGSTKPQYAMLGLGDVVLPGIMIGLALRFDLFLFYLRRQKRVSSADSDTPPTVTKPTYHSLAGRWTDHFWSHSFLGRPLWSATETQPTESPFTFPKTYFKASLVGYVLGMLATLGVMHVWGHAQPALLYLVPGVVGSLWTTALVRGELSLMWGFSEESEDEENSTDGKESQGRGEKERESIFSLSEKKAVEREKRVQSVVGRHVINGDEGAEGGKGRRRKEREVFSFSVEAPWEIKRGKEKKSKAVATRVDVEVGGGEHAGKRARVE